MSTLLLALSAGMAIVPSTGSDVREEPSGYELWGMRSKHPAIVNAVCPANDGLTHFWGRPLIRAQYALQAYWLKHGIEAARADPYCDGYHYWAAQDTVIPAGASYAAIGLYDSFWNEKPGGTPPSVARRFNSADCLLCDTLPAARIVTVGEPVTNTVLFAHYGD